MKKILISLCLVFCAVLSYAQLTPVPRGNANQIDQFRGVIQGVRGTIITPVDTTGNPLTTYYGALTVLPNDVNKDTIPIWMSNGFKWIRFSGGNGTNINDTIYTRAPVAVDRTTIPGKQIIYLLHLDGIVSPGYVVWTGMGLNFNVTPADYYIGYRQFFSSANLLTLAAAPVSNSRVDLFIVDTTATASVLTGTPGIGAAAPQTNPSSQLPLTTVTVNVGDTVPAGIALETIYNDHIAPPTEWLATTNGSIAADFDNTVNPYIGTKAIFVSTYANGSNITFTKGSGVDTVKAGEIIRGFVSFNISFTSQFQFQWFNGTTAVSNSISINSGYGINPNNVNNYQIFAIPLNAWNFTPASQGIYNKLVITMGGNDISGAGGFYMDYLQLQTGLINSTPDDFLDSVYTRNDSLFQYKHGIEMYRGKFSGGGGSVPTLQQVFNTEVGGSQLNKNDSIELNGNGLTILSPGATGAFEFQNFFKLSPANQLFSLGDLIGYGDRTYLEIDANSSLVTFNDFGGITWQMQATQMALPGYASGYTTPGVSGFVVSDTGRYKIAVIDSTNGSVFQSHWPTGGGGGSSLANFYLKDSSLSSDRTVNLNGKVLNFSASAIPILSLDPVAFESSILATDGTAFSGLTEFADIAGNNVYTDLSADDGTTNTIQFKQDAVAKTAIITVNSKDNLVINGNSFSSTLKSDDGTSISTLIQAANIVNGGDVYWKLRANNGVNEVVIAGDANGDSLYYDAHVHSFEGITIHTTQFTPANSTDNTYSAGALTQDNNFLYYRKSNGVWVKIPWVVF